MLENSARSEAPTMHWVCMGKIDARFLQQWAGRDSQMRTRRVGDDDVGALGEKGFGGGGGCVNAERGGRVTAGLGVVDRLFFHGLEIAASRWLCVSVRM